MDKTLKTLVIAFLGLLLISVGTMCFSLKYSHISVALLPRNKSLIPWKLWASSDSQIGGSSNITVRDSDYFIDFDFELTSERQFPYVSITQEFISATNPSESQVVDLSRYSNLSFVVKCDHENVLSFSLYTYENELTRPGDFTTYRIADAFFSCTKEWTSIDIDLTRLEVPQWWLEYSGIPLSRKSYQLNKALGLGFGISRQTPVDIESNVQLRELNLKGSKKIIIYMTGAFVLALWLAFIVWSTKLYARFLMYDIMKKQQKDPPLVDYQKLSITPRKDKYKDALLKLMASEYPDHQLNIETAAKKLGINRNKINDILREELGLTFSAYLNKIRLTEAARLLAEQSEVNVSEIASLVGYNNISYFNKLFKIEYGYAPNVFRDIGKKTSADPRSLE